MTTKDFMRNRIYNAEGVYLTRHPEATQSANELQQFATRVCKRAWFKRYPDDGSHENHNLVSPLLNVSNERHALCVPIRPIHSNVEIQVRGIHHAVDSSGSLSSELSVLHTLAHYLLRHYSYDGPIHDANFVKLYLTLVERYLGGDVRREFKADLLACKVKTRVVSEAQRAAARKRFMEKQTVPSVHADLIATMKELEELEDDE